MVKRATIHVSSRTKMNHPKKWRVRIITKDKKGNKKKTTNTTNTRFYNQVTLAGEAGCNIVLAKLLFWLFTLQQDCSRRSVVTCCKSCFSCFRYSAGSIEEFRPREALLHVVKVVLVVFPTQQAASKQHDTTLSIHLRCPSVPRMKQKTNSYE